ncbi:MAG: rod-binding protein [Spirochaetes bacterium]|nr:rod-binding protein [Spirochaetota bacterium]
MSTIDLNLDTSRGTFAQRSSELENLNRLQQQTQTTRDSKKLKEACQDFEAIFIKQMLDGMRKTVPRTELLERTLGEEIFEDMLYTEYAKVMSRRGSLGIADLLFKQLSTPTIQNK